MPEDQFTFMNQFSTISSYLLGASLIPFFWNVYITWRRGNKVTVDDPWGFGASLEWATSCPPPRHNFTSLPRIRSERPALDLHHPELSIRENAAADNPAADVLGAADIGERNVKDPDPNT
jgi:cytochrome c oxidase subunit 1